MDEAAVVLQVIRDELEKKCPELVAPLALTDEALSVRDGKLTLRVEVHHDPGAHPAIAHCHVVADTGDRGGVLEACVMGIHSDRRQSLADAARVWVTAVASPILSLARASPVLGSAHFDGSEPWGVAACHGFAGPMVGRHLEKGFDLGILDGAAVFDYVAEMAPPGILHIAKVTLEAAGGRGWNRTLEIDGHSACYVDHSWTAGFSAPSQAIISQFAVFHYAGNPGFIEARAKVDEAIRRFVSAFKATNDTCRAGEILRADGRDADLVHWVVALTPIAFGRVIFASLAVSFPRDFTRITRDGTAEDGLHLMHEPVFARSMALSRELMEGEFLDAVKKIALTGPEFNAINNALNAGSKAENLKLFPAIIPAPGAGQDAIERAMRRLQDRAPHKPPPHKPVKPWWQFWR